MFKRRVSKFIAENSLFSPHHKIIVALSGGADSVALLRVLLELGYTCECAHCNFHLRGEESKRDELFVRHLCNSLSIPLYVVDFDVKAYALQNKLSIEMAARELRYTWFEQLRKEKNADVIAVGPGGMVDGKEVTMQVKVGDRVIYQKYSGTDVKLGDDEYIVVKQNDIVAIVED